MFCNDLPTRVLKCNSELFQMYLLFIVNQSQTIILMHNLREDEEYDFRFDRISF